MNDLVMSALEEWTCVSVAGLGLTAARLGMPLATVHLERPARRRLRNPLHPITTIAAQLDPSDITQISQIEPVV